MDFADVRALVASGDFAIVSDAVITRNGKDYDGGKWLDDAWYSPIAGIGLWQGEVENVWIVPHMRVPAATHYGRTFSQTCVIVGNAIHYTDGTQKVVPLDCANAKWSDSPPDLPAYTIVTIDGVWKYLYIPECAAQSPTERLQAYADRVGAAHI